MKIGDKVYLEDRESEIIAISYDEQGEKIYTVKDSPKDYYEHDFYEFMHSELSATQNLLEEYKEAYADYQELGKEKLISDTMFELFFKDFHARNCTNFPCKYEEELKCFEEYYRGKAKAKLFENGNSEEGDHIPRID